MGGRSSRENSLRRQSSSLRSTSTSWSNQYEYPESSYPQPAYPQDNQNYAPQYAYPAYPPQQQYNPPPQNYGGRSQDVQRNHFPDPQRKLDRRYSRIADNYSSLGEVTEALARAGLESSNLIVGIDFTKSNEWTGAKSFNRRSLHHIGDSLNPYEQAISIIGKTLAAFDEDNLIPCYGFGDASTHDQDVFSFYPDDRFCNGFEEVLSRYREIVPHLRLAGPTSFAPIIEMAMTIVEQSAGQYHVLVIIADGQVTRSVDTERGQLSPQEQKTVEAIVEASKFPLSIILVGVGDGPWDMMREFDDNIPARVFDNFQFVNFTEIMSKNLAQSRKETEFALSALMEIPSQYKATIEFNVLGSRKGNAPERFPLPPPEYGAASFRSAKPSHSTKKPSSPPYYGQSVGTAPSSSHYYGQNTPVGTAPSSSHYYGQNTPVGTAPSSSPYYGESTSVGKAPSSSPYYGESTSVGTAPPAPSSSPYYDESTSVGTAPPAPSSTYDNQLCPICLSNSKDMAFGCGHQTCCDCGQDLQVCPICRSSIQTRIKLY